MSCSTSKAALLRTGPRRSGGRSASAAMPTSESWAGPSNSYDGIVHTSGPTYYPQGSAIPRPAANVRPLPNPRRSAIPRPSGIHTTVPDLRQDSQPPGEVEAFATTSFSDSGSNHDDEGEQEEQHEEQQQETEGVMEGQKGKQRAEVNDDDDEEEEEEEDEDDSSPVRDDNSTLKGIACPRPKVEAAADREDTAELEHMLGSAVSIALFMNEQSIVLEYCFAARDGIREYMDMKGITDPRWFFQAYADKPKPMNAQTLVYRLLEIGLEFVRDGAMIQESPSVVRDAANMPNRAFALALVNLLASHPEAYSGPPDYEALGVVMHLIREALGIAPRPNTPYEDNSQPSGPPGSSPSRFPTPPNPSGAGAASSSSQTGRPTPRVMIDRMEQRASNFEKFSMQYFRHHLREALGLLGGGRKRKDRRRREQEEEAEEHMYDRSGEESGMTSMYTSGLASPAPEPSGVPGGHFIIPNGHTVLSCPVEFWGKLQSEEFWVSLVAECLPRNLHPGYAGPIGHAVFSQLSTNTHSIVYA